MPADPGETYGSSGGRVDPSGPERPKSSGEAPAVDPAPAEPEDGAGSAVAGVHRCDLCDEPMLELHCKLVCPACGYQRDCSDP